MAGTNKNRIGHDDIYEATAAINGGQLVVPAAGATLPGKQGIAVAGTAALNVLGVAGRRAVAHSALTDTVATDGDGYPALTVNPVNELTVVYKGCVCKVEYTAVAVAYGVKLQAAASGKVAAYVPQAETAAADATALTGNDARAIIGECRVVGGMGSGGGTGFAYIY